MPHQPAIKRRAPYLLWAAFGFLGLGLVLPAHAAWRQDMAYQQQTGSPDYRANVGSGEESFGMLLLLLGAIALVVWGVMKVSGRRAAELTSTVTTAIDRASAAHLRPPSPAMEATAQLRDLAELRDHGVISDEEFQAKKTDILGRI